MSDCGAIEQSLDAARKNVERLEQELEDCQAVPPPQPEPPANSPKLGMSAPAGVWAVRKKEVEATGGKLQARRVFLTGLDSSITLIQAAHAEGLLPVVSYKPGDWGDVASGKSDSKLKALSQRLGNLSKDVVVCLHHEPDEKSTPVDQGEGGTAAEFAAMYRRATPLLKAAKNVKVWPIMNGWWWDGTKGALTDAQINVWLPSDVRGVVDGIAADDYSPESGNNPSVTKTKGRVAWAKRVGGVKATGIGEFNGFKASDLSGVIDYAATEPLFRGGFLLLWNSTGGSYKPLTETGLLDDFQKMLLDWPKKVG